MRRTVRHTARQTAGRTLRGALALGLITIVVACSDEPMPAPDAVVRFDAVELRYAAFESYLQVNIGETGSALASEVLSQLFDQFLDEQLLMRLAVDRGLAPEDTGARLAVAALLAEAQVEPTEEQVSEFFERNRSKFRRPDRVQLRQILVEDQETAELAARELAEGADFAAVAERLSIGLASQSGGDQGILARSDLPLAFAETIFALEAGGVSEIVPAEYGFHIFRVDEKLPARELTLAEAEPEIREQLRRQLTERRLTDLVREAKERYEPTIFARNLPFNYLGAYSGS